MAANKMMMLTDAHFTSWASVKILSLYDNNGKNGQPCAPCTGLEELRISGNLEEMPALSSHTALTTYEIHKNRIASVPDDYFPNTRSAAALHLGQPADGRATGLSYELWTARRRASPRESAHLRSRRRVAVDSRDPLPLSRSPGGGAFTLAPELGALTKLKRVNLGKLALDDASMEIADQIKKTCLSKPDGIFWGTDGVKTP